MQQRVQQLFDDASSKLQAVLTAYANLTDEGALLGLLYKTAYTRNITIEDWNILVKNIHLLYANERNLTDLSETQGKALTEILDLLNELLENTPRSAYVKTALTNFSGVSLQGYSTGEVESDTLGNGIQILNSGNALTLNESHDYMRFMTGSSYVAEYSESVPAYVYLTDSSGTTYCALYDEGNGMVLWYVSKHITHDSISQTLTDSSASIPNCAAVSNALTNYVKDIKVDGESVVTDQCAMLYSIAADSIYNLD